MDALLSQMSENDKKIVLRTYELDFNCLSRDYSQAPEYVLIKKSEEYKLAEANKVFDALRGAAEKVYGPLRDLPR